MMLIHYSTLTLVVIRTTCTLVFHVTTLSYEICIERETVEKHGYNAHVRPIQDDGHSYKCIVSTYAVYVTYAQHDKSAL